MGFPFSPNVANLFIDSLKPRSSALSLHPPRLWLRYVDDTFVIQRVEHSQQFLQHINSIDPHIQFTNEVPNTDGSIPFLDILVIPGPENTPLTSVYRKLTHTDQYFQWNSHHSLSAEYIVFTN